MTKKRLDEIKRSVKAWRELAVDGETDPMGSMLKVLDELITEIEANCILKD